LEIAVGTDERRITVKSGGGYDALVTSSHRGLDVAFPNIDKYLADGVPATTEGGMTVKPEYLARFAKVSQRDRYRAAMRVLFCGKGKPIRVEIGGQFIGLVSPMRDEETGR